MLWLLVEAEGKIQMDLWKHIMGFKNSLRKIKRMQNGNALIYSRR